MVACIVTITKVDLSQDLRLAKIYLSIFSNKENFNSKSVFDDIVNSKKHIRYYLGNKLESKYIPDIRFYLDNEYEDYDKINKLIKSNE